MLVGLLGGVAWLFVVVDVGLLDTAAAFVVLNVEIPIAAVVVRANNLLCSLRRMGQVAYG